MLYTVDAYHELFLSKHFPNYLGHNLIEDDGYYLHFMEITKGDGLK